MKNFLRNFAAAVAVCFAVVAFTGCGNDGEDALTGTISTETPALKFTSGTYAKAIDVKAENAGDIRIDIAYKGSETGWVTATKQEGGVLVAVTKNTSGGVRSAEVIISAKNAPSFSVPISQKAEVSSPVTGTWKPKIDLENSTEQLVYGEFFINAAWKDPENIPTLDMSFIFGEGALWPCDAAFNMIQSLVQGLYAGGLKSFEFKEDGTVGAGYCELLDFMNMQFSEEKTFPNAETLAVLPLDAITYFTQGDKVYFAIDKAYIVQVGKMLGGDLDIKSIIDGLLTAYPDLGIISNDEVYAVPFKYTVEGNVLTIKVDKEMIEPYKPLLVGLTGLIPEKISVKLDPTSEPMEIPARALVESLLDAVYNKTTTFEIGLRLEKK